MYRLLSAFWDACIIFGLLIVSGWAVAWWHPDSIAYRDRVDATIVRNCDLYEKPSKKSTVIATAKLRCADCEVVQGLDGVPLQVLKENRKWMQAAVEGLDVWVPKSCVHDLRR